MVTNRVRRMAGVLTRTLSESSFANGESDGELLTSFADRRNPLAFAELVHRHGPMVLGVCLRILKHRQDAEDAFQATFLVLARKAATVSPPTAVGNWLYGVALQTAVRARSLAMKRREREVLRPQLPETAVRESGWDDLAEVLDEELGRLPSRYRAVIVLCDVEGRTQADAAAHLGCPEGSVSSRLSRARSMLAKRLTKRGVTLSAGALALLIGQNATTAGVPASLARLTVEAVGVVTAGTVVSGGITPAVATLTEGVLKAMLVTKLKAVALSALVLGLVVLGGAVGFGRAGGQDPPKADARPAVKAHTETDERPASAPAAKAPPAMTHAADPDPVASLRELVKQSEGANQTWTYEADDKKWYRARVTARSVTVGDVTRTDSLITPFRGVIHWEGETAFSKPFATEDEASKAAPGTAVVKDPGDWRGEFEFRDGRWHFVKAQYWQDTRPGPKLTTPLSPTRLYPQYWRAVFERRVTHKEIQGVWKLESSGTGGRTRAATDADIRLTVTNEHCIWQERGQDRVSSYRLDPEKSPMQIDLTSLVKGADEGKVGRAIYRIEDDVLTICEPADATSPRPTRFSTNGKAGSGHLITVYKRVQEPAHPVPVLDRSGSLRPPAKKLNRVPDPTPELHTLLHQWDQTRPRTRAEFVELEEKAEAAARKFPAPDDQARIWFQVAHIIAQSDFTRQVDRFRTYAAKCLAISRDPLQRSLLYLNLASAEEVTDTDTPFADRRRKAADRLLTGYAELLVQELPDKQPEAPLHSIDNADGFNMTFEDGLLREARRAAQREARAEYEFVREQVGRRRMLVMHFQNFYKPAPNDPDRTSAAIDELRAVANRRMTAEQTRVFINAVLGTDDAASK